MMTLLAFHAALYFFQVARITNYMSNMANCLPPVELTRSQARPAAAPLSAGLLLRSHSGHDPKVKEMAERRYTEHFKEVGAYFHSAYLMKKLEEFA